MNEYQTVFNATTYYFTFVWFQLCKNKIELSFLKKKKSNHHWSLVKLSFTCKNMTKFWLNIGSRGFVLRKGFFILLDMNCNSVNKILILTNFFQNFYYVFTEKFQFDMIDFKDIIFIIIIKSFLIFLSIEFF